MAAAMPGDSTPTAARRPPRGPLWYPAITCGADPDFALGVDVAARFDGNEPAFGVGEEPADRPHRCGVLVGLGNPLGGRARLRHAVALDDRHPEPPLETRCELGIERRGGRDRPAHRGEIERVDLGSRRDEEDGRRAQVEPGDPVPFDDDRQVSRSKLGRVTIVEPPARPGSSSEDVEHRQDAQTTASVRYGPRGSC